METADLISLEVLYTERWLDDAHKIVSGIETMEDVVRRRGDELAGNVALDGLATESLRSGLEWAGRHYWAIAKEWGTDFSSAGMEQAQLEVATAIELVRSAGLLAVEQTRTAHRISGIRDQYEAVRQRYEL